MGEQGVDFDFRDYKKVPPSEAELAEWTALVGWETLLNKAGTTFRKLPEADKLGIDEGKAISLMAANPSLIKRPFVTGASKPSVGFKVDQWQAVFAQ